MLGQIIAACVQMGMRGQELANCILEMLAKG